MTTTAKPLRVLLGYSHFLSTGYPDLEAWTLEQVALLRAAGFDVEGFCLTLNAPGPRLSFRQMDARWRRGDPELLGMYERLEDKLRGKDVFINGPGLNLHPEFVRQLPVFTVFQCMDDPESSEDISRPVAHAYDLCMVGNAAEVETYRSWGVRNVEWAPMGLMPGAYDLTLTEQDILEGDRDIPLIMFADRLSPPRRERMERLAAAFPNGNFYGRGWPCGSPSFGPEQLALLRRARIGPNVHNSTGPINFRLFQLPANGVMQICDNKRHLGQVYELGKEVVGFDTVDEGIDLCRYYLEHDDERRRIAAAGWRRVRRDYTEVAVFKRALNLIERHRTAAAPGRPSTTWIACKQNRKCRRADRRERLREQAGRVWARLTGRT